MSSSFRKVLHEAEVDQIIRNLRHQNSDDTVLDLQGYDLSEEEDGLLFLSDSLLSAYHSSPALLVKTVNLSHAKISLSNLDLLVTTLHSLPCVTTFIARSCLFTKEAAVIISKLFTASSSTHSLGSQSRRGGGNGSGYGGSRGGGLSLTSIDLSDNILGDQGVAAFFAPFNTPFTLGGGGSSSGGSSGSGGCGALLSIQSINLSRNVIEDAGVLQLCRACIAFYRRCQTLGATPCLEEVLLNNNRFREKGAYSLAQLIHHGGSNSSAGSSRGGAGRGMKGARLTKIHVNDNALNPLAMLALLGGGNALLGGDLSTPSTSPSAVGGGGGGGGGRTGTAGVSSSSSSLKVLSMARCQPSFQLLHHLTSLLASGRLPTLTVLDLSFTETIAEECISQSAREYQRMKEEGPVGSNSNSNSHANGSGSGSSSAGMKSSKGSGSSSNKTTTSNTTSNTTTSSSSIAHCVMRKLVDTLLHLNPPPSSSPIALKSISLGVLPKKLFEFCLHGLKVGNGYLFEDCLKSLEALHSLANVFQLPFVVNLPQWVADGRYENPLYLVHPPGGGGGGGGGVGVQEEEGVVVIGNALQRVSVKDFNSLVSPMTPGTPNRISAGGGGGGGSSNSFFGDNAKLSSLLDLTPSLNSISEIHNITSTTTPGRGGGGGGAGGGGGVASVNTTPISVVSNIRTAMNTNHTPRLSAHNVSLLSTAEKTNRVGGGGGGEGSLLDLSFSTSGFDHLPPPPPPATSGNSGNVTVLEMKEQEYIKRRLDHTEALRSLSSEIQELVRVSPDRLATSSPPPAATTTTATTTSNTSYTLDGLHSTSGTIPSERFLVSDYMKQQVQGSVFSGAGAGGVGVGGGGGYREVFSEEVQQALRLLDQRRSSLTATAATTTTITTQDTASLSPPPPATTTTTTTSHHPPPTPARTVLSVQEPSSTPSTPGGGGGGGRSRLQAFIRQTVSEVLTSLPPPPPPPTPATTAIVHTSGPSSVLELQHQQVSHERQVMAMLQSFDNRLQAMEDRMTQWTTAATQQLQLQLQQQSATAAATLTTTTDALALRSSATNNTNTSNSSNSGNSGNSGGNSGGVVYGTETLLLGDLAHRLDRMEKFLLMEKQVSAAINQTQPQLTQAQLPSIATTSATTATPSLALPAPVPVSGESASPVSLAADRRAERRRLLDQMRPSASYDDGLSPDSYPPAATTTGGGGGGGGSGGVGGDYYDNESVQSLTSFSRHRRGSTRSSISTQQQQLPMNYFSSSLEAMIAAETGSSNSLNGQGYPPGGSQGGGGVGSGGSVMSTGSGSGGGRKGSASPPPLPYQILQASRKVQQLQQQQSSMGEHSTLLGSNGGGGGGNGSSGGGGGRRMSRHPPPHHQHGAAGGPSNPSYMAPTATALKRYNMGGFSSEDFY
eukprot:scaffold4302_cov183-Ochromonas_danica.AAC.7